MYDNFNKNILINFIVKIVIKISCVKFDVFSRQNESITLLQKESLKRKGIKNSNLLHIEALNCTKNTKFLGNKIISIPIDYGAKTHIYIPDGYGDKTKISIPVRYSAKTRHKNASFLT